MNRKLKIGLLVTAPILALAVVAPLMAGMKYHKFGKSGHMMEFIKSFDSDNNGLISQTEIDSAQTSRFQESDKDENGTMSITEFELLWVKLMRSRMVDRFQHLDEDGSGEVSWDEFNAPVKFILARVDENNDGEISTKEMDKLAHHNKFRFHHKE